MKHLARRAPALLVAMALALPAAHAGEARPAAPSKAAMQGRVSPDADLAISRMAQYLAGLESFTVVGRTTRDQIASEGFKLQHNEEVKLQVRRPDRMRVESNGDFGGRAFVYDGRQLAIHSVNDQAYVRIQAPPTLRILLGNALAAGIEMPLVDVVYQAVEGSLLNGVRGGVLVGDSTINGIACQQLAFRQGEVDWQIWIEKGDRPLPRKIVVTTRHELGQPQFQALLDWDLSPRFNNATFRFDAPAGSTELTFESAVPLDTDPSAGGSR